MPLTEAGKKAIAQFKKEYGEKKGEEVFYKSINAGTLPKEKMEHKKKKK